jgi:hypothetical protein
VTITRDGQIFRAGTLVVVRYHCPQFLGEWYMVGIEGAYAQEAIEADRLAESQPH